MKLGNNIWPRNFKLKAFTLIEFLVVIALSGIVVTLSYLVWQRSVEGFSLYEQSSKNAGELMRMKDALEDDFFEAQSVKRSENGVVCVLPDGKEIEYDFTGDEILRKVAEDEWALEMESITVEVIRNHEKQKESGALVDELEIELKEMNATEVLVWKVFKNYGYGCDGE